MADTRAHLERATLTSNRESYSTSRHNLGFYRCVALTARYSVRLSSLGDRNLGAVIEHAVAQTILSHPVLQAGIVGEDTTTPHFVYLPTLDLSELIDWEHVETGTPSDRDRTLQQVLETRHSRLWPELHRRPGYQFVILSPTPANHAAEGSLSIDIVFAFHHGYGDGTSGVILQRALLEALNNPAPVMPSYDPVTHTLTIEQPVPLAPPQDALIDFKISWSFLFKTLWDEFGPSFLKATPPEPAWTGKPITTNPEGTRLHFVSFPATTTSDILARCREHSTTLTPLLHILILHSLARRLPESALGGRRAFTSSTPISLRRLVPAGGKQGFFDPATSIGVMLVSEDHRFSASAVAQARSSFSTDDESRVWDLTASLAAELKRKVASLPNDDVTALMAWVSDWNARWRKMLGTERRHTWEVSNVGAADCSSGKDGGKVGWSMERMVFSQCASVAGSAFAVSVAGVRGGELAVTLSWQEGIVDDGLVDGVSRDLRAWLTAFAQTGRFGLGA